MFTFAKITIKKLVLLSVSICVLFALEELIHFRKLEKAETKFVSSLNLVEEGRRSFEKRRVLEH